MELDEQDIDYIKQKVVNSPKSVASVISMLNMFGPDAMKSFLLNNLKAEEEVSSYDDHKVEAKRPKKQLLDLSSYQFVPENEDEPDGPGEIIDVESGYEDETDSILKRLEVFEYQKVVVREDVAAVLIDKNPECFKDIPELEFVDGQQKAKHK